MRLAAFVLACASSAAFAADEDPIENQRLPRLWKVVRRTKVPAEQVAGVAKKLGVELTSLENGVLDAGGIPLKINVARCPDEKTAQAVWKKFDEIHGGAANYAGHSGGSLHAARRGLDVAEIVCGNRLVAQKAQHVIGWSETLPRWGTGMHWNVKMRIAPIEACDGMRWNRLFNLLRKSDDAKSAVALDEEAKSFTFADRVVLPPAPGGLSLIPKSAARRDVGDATEFTFDPLPRTRGVPCVEVDEHVQLETFRPSTKETGAGAWTGATAAWPIDAPEVRAAAEEALGKDAPSSPRERVERVLAWVHGHVRYGGDETGSRHGTVKVLKQGFGRCWDQSDAFVALCRAAGVPARQAGGWLKGSEGHVWAEVRLEGEGDLAVDPGTTWLGVSSDYVRLWVSDDGRTPFVYWDVPTITGPICIR